jgi:hypothetical protein
MKHVDTARPADHCDDRAIDPAEPVLRVDHGRPVPCPRFLAWVEARLNSGPQDWKQYTIALLVFNTMLFVFGFIVLLRPIPM